MTCPRCNRDLDKTALGCIVCGWRRDADEQKALDAGKVRAETFPAGATLWPFFGSGLFFGGLCWATIEMVRDFPFHDVRVYYLAAFAFFLFGPVMTLVQCLRRRKVWVRIDPDRGLVFSNGRHLPWEEIAVIDRNPGAMEYQDSLEQLAGTLPTGVGAHKAGCVLIPALFIYFVLAPVISVLSPWGARVTIHLNSGEKIVLRDLADSYTFCRMVGYKLEP